MAVLRNTIRAVSMLVSEVRANKSGRAALIISTLEEVCEMKLVPGSLSRLAGGSERAGSACEAHLTTARDVTAD